MTTITRSIEIDAGHRVPGHLGKCRNIHGHRYKIEVTIQGPVQEEGPESGMVVDFGNLKKIMVSIIEEPCDHVLMLDHRDEELLIALGWNGHGVYHQHAIQANGIGGSLYITNFAPTAENLAKHWFMQLFDIYKEALVNVRVYETPNCWADYPGTHQP